MNLINAEGFINCRLMSQFGLEKARPSTAWERNFLGGIRNGGCDFIYDKIMIKRIVKVLQPNEILLIHKIEDYFKVTLTTYQQQMTYYKLWCEKKHKDERNAVNLRKFIKEVKIIWH